ncbi:MAG TPA: HAMP domain-containing sensor histidine kinase, partial [Chitinophagaceae bacterium]|nr:HAMP domain-containing sensor histidine kinase [Chitinophagaceae bacterium]
INFFDTLYNEQMQKNTARLEAKYEYEKKEIALKDQQEKKDALNRDIVRNKELEIYIAILAILFLIVLAVVLFRSRAAKQKTNHVLEIKNSEIGRQKEEIEYQSLQLLLNNQQRDKLFSIIAHDLKTPLQSLKLALDLLEAKSLSEHQINMMMEELRQDADYSAGLVRNLLFWANSQLNGIVAKPVALDLRQLVNEVFDLFIKQASDKTIVLRNQVAPGLLSHADKDMLHVVIRNLVGNAVKFCRPGDTITIESKMAGDDIGICVADTGIGIKEGLLEKINEKKIVTTFGTANEKGTGLGLLLCREFVELNNGRFSIESKWGEGSRFLFTLPAYPAKKDPGNR